MSGGDLMINTINHTKLTRLATQAREYMASHPDAPISQGLDHAVAGEYYGNTELVMLQWFLSRWGWPDEPLTLQNRWMAIRVHSHAMSTLDKVLAEFADIEAKARANG